MTPGRRCRILVHEWVTGGGLAGAVLPASWAREGSAMRRAIAADFASLGRDRAQVVMTLDERLQEDCISSEIDVQLMGTEADTRLMSLAREADWTVLIAPETAGTLARVTRAIERAGGRTIGSSAEAVELVGDKLRCARWLGEIGVRTPEGSLLEPGAERLGDLEYPVVIKPVDGAGSLDTFLVRDSDDWSEATRAVGRAIVQPYVAGMPMSASFLADGRGKATLLGIGAQEVLVRDRKFAYRGGRLPVGEPVVEPSIRRAVESIAGLRGFVGLDFIKNESDGSVTVLEINPRPTTSYVGLCRLLPPGRLARAWLSVCGGGFDFDEDPWDGLAHVVHAAAPVRFDANGMVDGVAG